jgi:hypothetical protein
MCYIPGMSRRYFIVAFCLLGVVYASSVLAVDQSSANYQSIGNAFAPTVKDISSPNYFMTASLDAIVGRSASAGFILQSGPAYNDTTTAPVVPPPPPPPPPPSGGGGGGGGPTPTPVTGADFSGRAYPQSDVILLKDGQIAVTTIAGPDGKFKASLSNIQAGSYTFGLYAEDSAGVRSSIFAFPISVTSGTIATVTGIFIAPTISVDKEVVKHGNDVVIFGESAPGAEMTIQVNSTPIYVKTDSDATDGGYIYTFNTGLIENGPHTTKSKATLGGTVSSFSLAVGFEVNDTGEGGDKWICRKADLNCDTKVNLIDFSIAAFWYKRPLDAQFIPIEIERLNGDGKVDLIDFSIMAYYWTG